MAISDNYVPTKTTGDGATTVFTGGWPIFNEDYLKIYLENKTTGVQVLQTKDTDYSVTFTSSGWSVDFSISTAPPATEWVVGERVITQEQQTPYKTSSGFDGKVLENSVDVLTAMVQELDDAVDRSFKFQVASTSVGLLPTPTDGELLAWDGTSGAVKNVSVTSISDSLDTTISSLADNDILVYNSTGGVWENQAGVGTTEIQDNAVTGAKIAMGSDAQGDILFYGGTDYERLAAGTSGRFLKTQGAGADPVWADVNQGVSFLGTYTASNGTSIDIGSGLDLDIEIDDTYDNYLFLYNNLIPATDGVNFLIRMGNGGAFDSGASDYGWVRNQMLYSGSETWSGNGNNVDSSIAPTQSSIGSATAEGVSGGHFFLRNAANTSRPTVLDGNVQYSDGGGNEYYSDFGGLRNENAAHDRVRLLFSSGNISGTVSVYGLSLT